MGRPGQPPAGTLRNRNRINNKSRLKIVHGNLDTDTIIPDEDDEKNRLLQSVAGVDQEDANEHHLQQVLSAAAQQNHRPTRGAEKEKKDEPKAYIPTPDSTGVVSNHEQLYPSNKWKDPIGYVYSTSTVEESVNAALVGGFTYYMDERDAEWLAKNNEEARGEGTSAQGSVSPSGTKVSPRSSKGKEREPDSSQPVAMSEDVFELVMGLFEKTTHDKTEFLHHSLETGMTFPPFTDYQEIFSSPLPPPTFTSFSLPAWLPSPPDLTRIAQAVYPYWKERRLERSGHRIIPNLNFDETDTLNEGYICFRRRDVKAVRKTRASQINTSDKLARLQAELTIPLDLAKSVLQREELKRDALRHSQHIWEQRMQMVELRLQNPALAEKGDDELLIDKERLKKSEQKLKIPPKAGEAAQPTVPQKPRPKDLAALIQNRIDGYMAKHKEHDQHWEDVIDTGYVAPPTTYGSRLFKYISSPQSEDNTRSRRPVRMRYGRGGRVFMDRRMQSNSTLPKRRDRANDDDAMDVDDVDDERSRRLAERWRYDSDDGPTYGPGGSDEQDRIIVDDFDHRYLRYTIPLLTEQEVTCLVNDPTFIKYGPDGQKEAYVPFRLGQPPRILSAQQQQQLLAQVAQSSVPVSQQMKVPNPGEHQNVVSAVRRQSISAVVPSPSTPTTTTSTSPPKMVQIPQPTMSSNGNRPAINLPHVDGGASFSVPIGASGTLVAAQSQPQPNTEAQPQAQAQSQAQSQPQADGQTTQASPKTTTVNGTSNNGVNPYAALGLSGLLPSQFTPQQVQTLRSALNSSTLPDAVAQQVRLQVATSMHLPNGTTMNPKLPPVRQNVGNANSLVQKRANGSPAAQSQSSPPPRAAQTHGHSKGGY